MGVRLKFHCSGYGYCLGVNKFQLLRFCDWMHWHCWDYFLIFIIVITISNRYSCCIYEYNVCVQQFRLFKADLWYIYKARGEFCLKVIARRLFFRFDARNSHAIFQRGTESVCRAQPQCCLNVRHVRGSIVKRARFCGWVLQRF